MNAVVRDRIEMIEDTLESRGYVASEHDIEEIALESLHAAGAVTGVRQTYLRALVATTKSALGMGARKRQSAEMDPKETERQLAALEETHSRFYAVVMRVAEKIPIREEDKGKDRSQVYAARGTFARTSKSTLRAWVSSGGNLASLVPSKVTKYALALEVSKSRSPAQARAPSERYLHGVAAKILGRIRAAKDATVQARLIETVLGDLLGGLSDLGVETGDIVAALKSSTMPKTHPGHRQAQAA